MEKEFYKKLKSKTLNDIACGKITYDKLDNILRADKDEENLSKAYGGGNDGNLGAGKFMNKGGLAKKRKRTTKKK